MCSEALIDRPMDDSRYGIRRAQSGNLWQEDCQRRARSLLSLQGTFSKAVKFRCERKRQQLLYKVAKLANFYQTGIRCFKEKASFIITLLFSNYFSYSLKNDQIHLFLVCCAVFLWQDSGRKALEDYIKPPHILVGCDRAKLIYFCTCRAAHPFNFFIPSIA